MSYNKRRKEFIFVCILNPFLIYATKIPVLLCLSESDSFPVPSHPKYILLSLWTAGRVPFYDLMCPH